MPVAPSVEPRGLHTHPLEQLAHYQLQQATTILPVAAAGSDGGLEFYCLLMSVKACGCVSLAGTRLPVLQSWPGPVFAAVEQSYRLRQKLASCRWLRNNNTLLQLCRSHCAVCCGVLLRPCCMWGYSAKYLAACPLSLLGAAIGVCLLHVEEALWAQHPFPSTPIGGLPGKCLSTATA